MLLKKGGNANAWCKKPGAVEWPTLFLIGAMYLAFALLTIYYERLPGWVLMPLAAYVLALYSSLQHEILHGHPTRWPWLNEALLFPSLTLWMPYTLYKESHLVHHHNADLTDPERDPESFYIPRQRWQALSPGWQAYYRCYNTVLGRLLWGPVHLVSTTFYNEFRAMLKGDAHKVRIWCWQMVACALVLWWVMGVCAIPFWAYVLLFVYPGISLALLRSFLEHQAAEDPKHRSVIVETGWLLSLLFLNNNLHALHHAAPGLAWYRLPAVWRARREVILEQNNGYYFPGYGDIVRRYGWRAKETPCYPTTNWRKLADS